MQDQLNSYQQPHWNEDAEIKKVGQHWDKHQMQEKDHKTKICATEILME